MKMLEIGLGSTALVLAIIADKSGVTVLYIPAGILFLAAMIVFRVRK